MITKIRNKIKNKVTKAIKKAIDKPLPPPTEREEKLVAELRETFRGKTVNITPGMSPSEREWAENSNQLRELVLNDDPRRFLRWLVISNTMFVSDAEYVKVELRYLKERPDWESRWKNAVRESIAGHPIPYLNYPASSANQIHHTYHLALYEEKIKKKISEMDLVFEFGGGYGSMCRLFYNLGFKGTYVILDLPQFTELQKFYLKMLDLPVKDSVKDRGDDNAIYCISGIEDLNALVGSLLDIKKNSLFLATWSLSETPASVRETVLPLISRFNSYLIAFQDRFGEMDNREYFSKFSDGHKDVSWQGWPIEHIPGNNYLMGLR